MKTIKKLLLILTLIFITVACKEETVETVIPSYKVMKIAPSEGEILFEFPTTIQAEQVITVRPRVEGFLDKVFFAEGSFVRKGAPLFQINQDDFRQRVISAQAEVLAAEANVSNAQLEIQRITPLVQRNIISEFQLQTAQIALKAAEARVKQAKATLAGANISLGWTTITAPVSGVVSQINVREGALIRLADQTPMTTISADGDMIAYFSISENMIPEAGKKIGSNNSYNFEGAQLRLANGQIYSERGKLDLASRIVNQTTGTVLLKAIFPNKDRILATGQSGVVMIPITVPDAILIPKTATYQLLNKTMVVTVDSQNRTHSNEITIGGNFDNYYVVTDGVKAGDIIVLEGVSRLRDGVTVKPVF